MINLLPENEKKDINKEYRLRRLALVFFFVFLIMVFIAIFLLPSFVLSEFKARAADTRVSSTVMKSNVGESDIVAKIEITKNLTTTLKPEPYTVPSDIIDLLVKYKTSNNVINSVSYTRDAGGGIIVNVSGVAKTRQGLVLFTDTLRKEPLTSKIDVPVSNFTKDNNIGFSFTITIPKK